MNNQLATSVARNTTVMMAQQLTTWLSTFILMLFLPRYLGAEEYGKLYLALSIESIFVMLVSFGGIQSIAKMVSRSRETAPYIVANAVGFRLVLSAVAILAAISFSFVAGYHRDVRILIGICSITFLWQGLQTVLYGCYQGFEMLPYTSMGSVAERAFVSVVGVIALLMGARSLTMAIVIAMGTLLNFGVLAMFARRIITFVPRIDWKVSFQQMKEGVPFFLFLVFGSIYYRIDAIMLSFLTPEKVVGWYGAAYRFFDVLNFLPSIFTISVFPILSRLWNKEGETHSLATRKSLSMMILAAIPISTATFIFAPNIIGFFYGLPAYKPSGPTLQVLSCGLLFLYIDMVLGTALLAFDKQKQLSLVAFCAIPVNVGLNYFMIPLTQSAMGNGGVGAAAATILTELCVMVSAVIIMPRGVLKGFGFWPLAKGIASGVVMVLSFWIMRLVGVPWIPSVILGFTVYTGTLILTRTFEPDELAFAKTFLTFQSLKRTFVLDRSTPA